MTTEEAKARLREAAQRASPSAWLQRRPWNALGVAIGMGFIISRLNVFSVAGGATVGRWFGPMLLGMAIRRLLTHVGDESSRR